MLISPSPFEESVLGHPCGRLEFNKKALVSCRLSEGDARIPHLIALGFREVETLVTFSGRGWGKAGTIAANDDLEQCLALASCFTHDRFHADPLIPNHLADEIKRRWIENSFNGRADSVFIARDKAIAGFCICLPNVIDLIAVREDKRNMGFGTMLVRAALHRYRSITVGTQASNLPSMSLYRKCGLREVSRKVTLHLHA